MGCLERMRMVPPCWPRHADRLRTTNLTLETGQVFKALWLSQEEHTLDAHQAENSLVEIHANMNKSIVVPGLLKPSSCLVSGGPRPRTAGFRVHSACDRAKGEGQSEAIRKRGNQVISNIFSPCLALLPVTCHYIT